MLPWWGWALLAWPVVALPAALAVGAALKRHSEALTSPSAAPEPPGTEKTMGDRDHG